MTDLGRVLLLIGGVFFLLGLMLILLGRLPFLGKLPGDISFQWGNLQVFMPLATMILLSVVLTVVLNLVVRALNK